MSSNDSSPVQYDIVFAGGGAAACVCAGRLAAADPSLKILILEAGPHIRDVPTHVQPARYFQNLASNNTLTYHVGNISEHLNGRAPIVPSGRCVGGGSGINFQMYTRAAASDYDDWEAFGNPGWGSKELIQLSNKVETYQVDNSPKHGHTGPIKVSVGGGYPTKVSDDYLAVAAAYDKDRVQLNDTNDFGKVNGYARWHKYIDQNTGRRSDTAHHFIYNQDHNKNLVVKDRCRVSRILFEGNRATGVEFIPNDEVNRQPNNDKRNLTVSRVLASKFVVLSGGAFGSPAILERSGLGDKTILESLDIPVLVDLPGVGENYNDHSVVFTPYYVSEDTETMDAIFRGGPEQIQPYLTQWLKDGQGFLAHNGVDIGVKIRPTTEKDFVELGDDFKGTWDKFYAKSPDKAVAFTGIMNGYIGLDPTILTDLGQQKYISPGYLVWYPVCRGHVHTKSKDDPYAAMNFTPGYLDNTSDLAVLRWMYKHSRELTRRMKVYRGGVPSGHPQFPAKSAAVVGIGRCDGPDAIDAKPIEYTEADHKAIDEFHRNAISTSWHSLGTCAMKPREHNGVVDPKLNVYGVTNLKIVDLSIAPSNVGANTYNTALIVGEKGALILAEELGIQGV